MRLFVSVLTLVVVVSACHTATEPADGCVAVQGRFDPRAPAFIILYENGTEPLTTTARLSAKYSFNASILYTAPPGFAAELSPSAVKGLQCEPEIRLIEHDSLMMLGS